MVDALFFLLTLFKVKFKYTPFESSWLAFNFLVTKIKNNIKSEDLMDIEIGPMGGPDNFAKSAEIFKQFSMQCGSICELIGGSFVDDKAWKKLYKPVKSHKVYKDSIDSISDETKKKVMKMIREIHNEK